MRKNSIKTSQQISASIVAHLFCGEMNVSAHTLAKLEALLAGFCAVSMAAEDSIDWSISEGHEDWPLKEALIELGNDMPMISATEEEEDACCVCGKPIGSVCYASRDATRRWHTHCDEQKRQLDSL